MLYQSKNIPMPYSEQALMGQIYKVIFLNFVFCLNYQVKSIKHVAHSFSRELFVAIFKIFLIGKSKIKLIITLKSVFCQGLLLPSILFKFYRPEGVWLNLMSMQEKLPQMSN
jgi:hypothetical protein